MTTMGFEQVVMLALIPAAGNFLGGAIAEFIGVSKRTLSLALHFAVGIVLGVISVELIPRAMGASSPGIIIAAFFAGGCFAVGIDKLIDWFAETRGSKSGSKTGATLIFFGTAVDLFSDGVMIGTGSAISFQLAAMLALGQVVADIPEGFAAIATFKGTGVGRRRRLLLSASFAVPVLLGAIIGFGFVRGRPEVVKLGFLAFTAGVLTAVSVEGMLTEAHAATRETGGKESSWQTLALIGGFALFILLSSFHG